MDGYRHLTIHDMVHGDMVFNQILFQVGNVFKIISTQIFRHNYQHYVATGVIRDLENSQICYINKSITIYIYTRILLLLLKMIEG